MSESKWRAAVWQPMAEHVLRHMGYTDAEIERYVPPPNHEAMGCEFDSNHMRWDCYDENDTSRHPNHDDVGQVVEIVGVALEADALSPVLAQMKREWQAEAEVIALRRASRDLFCRADEDLLRGWADNIERAEASGREGER